ncbi:hypothetical protein CONLIGDRAFT_687154 [Coniochaeta ligniaria NRRL 30616]|uniref:C2H2-type domain-containing protein n=1 Tax=Coniochaeta ligniaria NRRL 30616 TaxID=1408157 RepID=A0A1J7I523_9PEZI|nr:hypothetical protein CONLIGDRAFT_687154 [Coniochaeta ligniaria NRRL 30616]
MDIATLLNPVQGSAMMDTGTPSVSRAEPNPTATPQQSREEPMQVCPKCDDQINYDKENLARHLKEQHSIVQKFCPIPGCERALKGFNRMDTYHNHMMRWHHNVAHLPVGHPNTYTDSSNNRVSYPAPALHAQSHVTAASGPQSHQSMAQYQASEASSSVNISAKRANTVVGGPGDEDESHKGSNSGPSNKPSAEDKLLCLELELRAKKEMINVVERQFDQLVALQFIEKEQHAQDMKAQQEKYEEMMREQQKKFEEMMREQEEKYAEREANLRTNKRLTAQSEDSNAQSDPVMPLAATTASPKTSRTGKAKFRCSKGGIHATKRSLQRHEDGVQADNRTILCSVNGCKWTTKG